MRISGVPGAARRARWAVSVFFLVMGMCAGVWMARIPAVKAQARLSDGTLGLALLAIPAGLMLGATIAERLVDRVGSARVARACGAANCLLLVTPGLARDLPELMAALLAVGVSSGTLDVAQNAQGVRVEAAYRRPVMTSMHAFFSLGSIAGALAGGGFAWAGAGPLLSFAVVGLAGAVADGVAGRWLLAGRHEPAVPAAAGERAGQPGAAYAATAAGGPAGQPGAPDAARGAPRTAKDTKDTRDTKDTTGTGSTRHVRRLIIALGVLGVCALAAEGAAGDWSAVYLRDNLGTSPGAAALGFAAFSVTMTAGRAVGDRLIRRFGTVRLVRAGGLLAAAGLAGGLVISDPYAAVAGFAVFGAGLSVVVPQVFAAGGRADPARPGSGLAKVVGFGYAGQTAGPAVIGAAASRVGLHLALVIPVLLALWIAAGASALGTAGGKPGAEPAGEPDAKPAGSGDPAGAEHAPVPDNSRPAAGADQRPAYGRHMDDKEILGRITGLIETERELRSQLASGELSSEQERERLRSAEEALDQCWDLLRQRRARREFGEDPDGAVARPTAEVEGYQQ